MLCTTSSLNHLDWSGLNFQALSASDSYFFWREGATQSQLKQFSYIKDWGYGKKCFCYLKSHQKSFRWFLLWKGLTSPSLGTGTWSLAGGGICVSNMLFANFQENIPNLANNYKPLKNLDFAHGQQAFYRVYSWNLRTTCPYWVFPISSLQFTHHSLWVKDHAMSPHRSCLWPPMQHGEGSCLIQMQRGQLF